LIKLIIFKLQEVISLNDLVLLLMVVEFIGINFIMYVETANIIY